MNGSVPPVFLYTFMVRTGMILPSVGKDVLFSGCTKLFNVCLTEYDLHVRLCILLVQVQDLLSDMLVSGMPKELVILEKGVISQ